MKTIGQILLWLGFLSGSLATVYHLPAAGVEHIKNLEPDDKRQFEVPDLSDREIEDDSWALIPWTWFGISAGVCLVGVVLIRSGAAFAVSESTEDMNSNVGEIQGHLRQLIENAEKLNKTFEGMAPSKITAYIDDVLADDLRSFAEGRECLIPAFGLNIYADVMTEFASAERNINRAWSAAADGYVDEAKSCIERALGLLSAAMHELDQAGGNRKVYDEPSI